MNCRAVLLSIYTEQEGPYLGSTETEGPKFGRN